MDKTILDNKAMKSPLDNKVEKFDAPFKKKVKEEKCTCTHEDIMKKAKELNITFNQAAKLCK